MDNLSNPNDSNGKPPWRFWARLLIVKSWIGRLVSMASVTDQDLTEAGVYLRRTRD